MYKIFDYSKDPFFDAYGLVKPRLADRGENGILFRAYLDALSTKHGVIYDNPLKAFWSNFDTRVHFSANPPEYASRYSIDNMTALYYLAWANDRKLLRELPIFYWNDKIWAHPNGFMVFLSVRIPMLKPVFWPFIFIMALYSALRPHNETSGKLLWWLRLHMLEMHKTLRFMEKVIRRGLEKEDISTTHSPYGFCFLYYFTNGLNPDWLSDGTQMRHPIIRYMNLAYLEKTIVP